MVAVGGATKTTIAGLLPGAEYFFAATVVDSVGLESAFSNEISYQVPGALVVTAANQSRTYGAANPTLTGTVAGLQNGDNLTATFSTAATPGSPVGTYSIVPTLIDPGGKLANYNVTINNGILTVSPAALTVTAASTTSLYGAPVPALIATYSGFVNGDTLSSLTTPPTLGTTATAASPVGSYPITASGAASPNYTISYASGTLTVTKAASSVPEAAPKIIVDSGLSRNLAITNLGNGSVAIGGEGVPGSVYIIQYTTNTPPTMNWLSLGTVTADSSGAFVLVDGAVSGLQFYRAIYP
jgi:hypothetical protein